MGNTINMVFVSLSSVLWLTMALNRTPLSHVCYTRAPNHSLLIPDAVPAFPSKPCLLSREIMDAHISCDQSIITHYNMLATCKAKLFTGVKCYYAADM